MPNSSLPSNTTRTAPGAPPVRPWAADLTARNIGIAIGLGVLAAVALSPLFVTPLVVLLGRTLFLALLLLVVFALAGRWPERWRPGWMPRGTVQVLAVALSAPLATLGTYLLSTGGNLQHFLDTPARVLGFLLIAGVALLIGLVLTPMALLRERDAQVRSQALQFALERSTLERQALDARLSLLQAQIEPHFLFNTLANVQALVESGSPRAPAVLSSLIAYLRAAMPRLHGGAPTLGDELSLVRAYLELMQMRMPDRLQFTIGAVDPAVAARRFPAMALLTLVENAVCHGIDPAEQGGRIDVGAHPEADGALRLWVEDGGVGLSPHASPGTGLGNLRSRLQAFYGDRAALELSEVTPHGLRAELRLPPDTDGATAPGGAAAPPPRFT
ncbi:MAG: histidine kinase [Rubrivivax sp.]